MRRPAYLTIAGPLLPLFSIIVLGLAIAASTSTVPDERTEIIRVFREALRLNDEFKRAAGAVDPNAPYHFEYQEKRRAIEEFSDDVLDPKLNECVKVLSSSNDMELAQEFFRLLIGFENSANETLSYSMGAIFLENPKVILEAFPKFSKDEQRYLYRKLDWGWQNVVTGVKNKPKSMLADRNERLKQLRTRVFTRTE